MLSNFAMVDWIAMGFHFLVCHFYGFMDSDKLDVMKDIRDSDVWTIFPSIFVRRGQCATLSSLPTGARSHEMRFIDQVNSFMQSSDSSYV